RLDHDRIADFLGNLQRLARTIDCAEIAWYRGDPRLRSKFFRLDLVAHQVDCPRIGTNEHDTGFGKRFSETGPLGKEAIARMNSFCAGASADLDDPFTDEIGLARGRRSNPYRLIGHIDVQRACVRV